MAQDDVSQIIVGGTLIGLIGMKQILKDDAPEYAGRPDDEIKFELFNRISRKNYIPENLKDEYANAFLREFKRYLGMPVKDEPDDAPKIWVSPREAPRCC